MVREYVYNQMVQAPVLYLFSFNLIILPSAAPIDQIEAIAVRRCKLGLPGRKRAKHAVRLSRPTEQLRGKREAVNAPLNTYFLGIQ